MAGTGKKADTKKPSIWEKNYFGKHGFINKNATETNAITIRDVDEKIPGWLETKQATQEAGIIILDLKKLGYDKLLGTGKITKKAKITVAKASPNAAEKIKAAGGELVNK